VNSLTKEQVSSLIEQGELVPVYGVDNNNELFYTEKWSFEDTPTAMYKVQKQGTDSYEIVGY